MDSTSVFLSRAQALGLRQACIDALVAGGIDTAGKLAFCSAYQVGSTDERALIAVLDDALGTPSTLGDKASFRRLFFECATMAMADLKNKVERTDDSKARKIPPPERSARYNLQVARLVGMSLLDEHECSHALLDDVAQQREDDVLKYLPVERCTKRMQELTAGKDKSAGDIVADTSTELRTRAALCRRALAYDQSNLMSFEIMEKWQNYMLAQMMRVAPEKLKAVSMALILQADKHLFMALAGLTRSGIAPSIAGVKPMETHMDAARADPRLQCC